MLRKLLKYDFRAILKYWWILAVSSIGLSFIGGICIRILTTVADPPVSENIWTWIVIIAVFGLIACILGLSAFLIATEIFIYVRFYQNLFSDEGYLTFTLPVKRRDILHSKLISGIAVNAMTLFLLIADVFIIVVTGVDSETLAVVRDAVSMFIRELFKTVGALSIVYILEAIVLLLALSVSSFLLTAICITFAAVVAKKHKIFAAIGFYYIAGAVMSVISQLAVIFGTISLAGILSALPEESMLGIISLIILSITAFICAITAALYTLEHYLLDRKLNLS